MRVRTNLFAAAGIVLALASSGLAQRGNNPPILPDPRMTPGSALDVTAQDICVPGYTKKVRNVPQAVKEQAYKNYGILHHGKGEFEVDHLISLELGGSNSIKNLWPESYLTEPWNAHVKDALENELHKRICNGTMDMKAAQGCIAKDWISCYKKTFNTDGPVSKGGKQASAHQPTNPPEGKVANRISDGHWNQAATREHGVGEHKIRQVLSEGTPLLWQNQRRQVHDRSGSPATGLCGRQRSIRELNGKQS